MKSFRDEETNSKYVLFLFLPYLSLNFTLKLFNAFKRRADFIQTMVDHEETNEDAESKEKETKNKRKLTDKEILAQAILFLAAGYETTATTLGFFAHNMAMNPEYQQKLIDEVDEILQKHVILLLYFIFSSIE